LLHILSLGTVLAILWALLSGHFDPLMIGLGAASCILVVVIAHRMDVIDHEGHPNHLGWRAVLYWGWLLKEILKSSLTIARILVQPKIAIAPRMVAVKSSQKSELGRVIYANSITLTPGTVTTNLEDETLYVHALVEECAKDLESGDMDRRVTVMEGETPPANKDADQ
jgi:multicomponent Na+:H+ antiporter subunit E